MICELVCVCSTKRSAKGKASGKAGSWFWKNVALGFKTPHEAIEDRVWHWGICATGSRFAAEKHLIWVNYFQLSWFLMDRVSLHNDQFLVSPCVINLVSGWHIWADFQFLWLIDCSQLLGGIDAICTNAHSFTRVAAICAGTYIDKKCPFTSNVCIQGSILTGTVNCAKMTRTIIVRRDYLLFVRKYHRSVFPHNRPLV